MTQVDAHISYFDDTSNTVFIIQDGFEMSPW